MVALDGIPFVKFCSSFDLRQLLINKGFNVPSSATTIKEIVMKYGDGIKKQVKLNILEYLSNKDAGLSLSFDEWTSLRNRKYVNINVHGSNKFWKLGLARIKDSFGAGNCYQTVETKLKDFHLEINKLIGMSTDGAAVMVRVGKDMNLIHQLCLAHGIHLAVIKVLYNKNGFDDVYTNADELAHLNEDNNSEDESDCENGDYMEIFPGSSEHEENFETIQQLYPIIAKIRKTVKIFRHSTKNNDLLQKYVVTDFNKELSLILNTKTRWNSLLAMMKRFYLLKTCVQKYLLDLKIDVSFSDDELKAVDEIITSLLPITMSLESICSANSTLLSADASLKFMLDELSNQNSFYSNELKNALLFQINKRRTQYSDVLQYLHNLDDHISDHNYLVFNRTNKSTIIKLIVSLIERLNMITSTTSDDDLADDDGLVVDSSSEGEEHCEKELNMKERLISAIKKKTKPQELKLKPIELNNKNITTIMRREIALYEQTKERGVWLNRVYQYLLTIKPTSVDAERAFSSAGQLCNKIRSRLNDDTLDMLCFLRAYFNQQNDIYKLNL